MYSIYFTNFRLNTLVDFIVKLIYVLNFVIFILLLFTIIKKNAKLNLFCNQKKH